MKEKACSVIEILKHHYPDALCALQYEKDYELMIAVRLSAQCTDARVNLVTPALFAAYPTLESLANANVSDIETYIHSCGFYRQKARDIIGMAQQIIERFDGTVPDNIEDLTSLPGVGRKTAQRLAFFILSLPEAEAEGFANAVLNAKKLVKFCKLLV